MQERFGMPILSCGGPTFDCSFCLFRWRLQEDEGPSGQLSQMSRPRPAKSLGTSNADQVSSVPKSSLLPSQLPSAVQAQKAPTATKSREQEAGKASSLGLPDLPVDFVTEKTVLDNVSKRSPHLQVSGHPALSDLTSPAPKQPEKSPAHSGRGNSGGRAAPGTMAHQMRGILEGSAGQ